MLLLVDVVVQELHNQVDVSEDHASAAVAFAAELVQRVFGVNFLFVDEVEVAIPLVAHDFATGEAANGDDHFLFIVLSLERGFGVLGFWGWNN